MATLRSVKSLCLIAVTGCLAAAVSGCGSSPTQAEQQRDIEAVVQRFGDAFAARDAATICREILAPELRKSVEGIGLSCEDAIGQSAAAVRRPRLEILGAAVRGDRGYVTARSTAQGQEPSVDRLALVQTDDGWRITSLNTEDELSPEDRPKPSKPTRIGRTTPTVVDRTVTVNPETPIGP